MSDSAGTIASLWRYPVKSMQGEEVNASWITERGLFGDRAYALLDAEDGKTVTAKNPKKWPTMFRCRAAFAEAAKTPEAVPPVRITLPDGIELDSRQPDLNQTLSQNLGRAVTFESQPPAKPHLDEYWPDDVPGLPHSDAVTDENTLENTFFDLAILHLLTTATIDHFRTLYPAGRFEARRFRPNIIVSTPAGTEGFIENDWIGHTVALGDEVRLEITGPCPRCVMTTLPQADLPKDPGILRAAVQHNDGGVGVYARVVQSGTVRQGDVLRVL